MTAPEDPIHARLIAQDRKMRAAVAVLRDMVHADIDTLEAACTTIETHTRNADLLRRVATAREIIKHERKQT
ncbi:hypothetical protein [uncultured Sulfitobacter sp.]|uniref:hypothetical protein n=1 Tax=uncultured Sulfitobacter sp. TaxID=191468 RepID=UPI00261AFE43|nr:hypothetical protein [uncultured Sulfitobacter sp.]